MRKPFKIPDIRQILKLTVGKGFVHGNPVILRAGYLKEADLVSIDGINDGAVMIFMPGLAVFHANDVADLQAVGLLNGIIFLPVPLRIHVPG